MTARPLALAVERAPAKVNLRLRILALQADGYHALDTVFQALELHDTLEATAADVTTLSVTGDVDVGPAGHNLVLRAARAFRDAVPDAPHVAFRLAKHIPSGAGLGGGSSDAAAALRALNALSGEPLTRDELREMGATLGADVAFFLCGSPLAHATGRGERLTPLPPMPPAPVVVVDPGFPVSTGDAFAWWDEHVGARDLRPPLSSGIPVTGASVAELMRGEGNDFETVVFERHPVLGRVRDLLLESGARAALLSGSGSCVFGVYDAGSASDAPDDAPAAASEDALDARLRELLPSARVLRTRTLGDESR